MKKIAFVTLILFVVSTGSALAAFEEADTAGTLTIGSTAATDVKLSKGVALEYVSETDGLGYVVGTSHSSGTKTFASSSGDSKIWSKDGIEQSIPSTAPAGTESADFSGWTAL